MMKKNKNEENFLLRIPLRKEGIGWSSDEKGIITLEIENKGFYNRLFQKLLKKPKMQMETIVAFAAVLQTSLGSISKSIILFR